MKCFVVSLHRSGTKSTAELLRKLGFRTIHWPARHRGTDFQAKIEGRETNLGFVLDAIAPVIDIYDGAADVPLPALYQQLYARYPDARFILLHRDPAQWTRSVRKHIGGRAFDPFERVQYWHYFRDRPNGLSELSDKDLASMHLRHTAEVIDYFARCSPRQLLALGLDDVKCGARIGAFLGQKRAPALPYVTIYRRREGLFRRIQVELARARRKLGEASRKRRGSLEPVL